MFTLQISPATFARASHVHTQAPTKPDWIVPGFFQLNRCATSSCVVLRYFIHSLCPVKSVCSNVRVSFAVQYNTTKTGLLPSASCGCDAERQTANHVTSECPLNQCTEVLVGLDQTARAWLQNMC